MQRAHCHLVCRPEWAPRSRSTRAPSHWALFEIGKALTRIRPSCIVTTAPVSKSACTWSSTSIISSTCRSGACSPGIRRWTKDGQARRPCAKSPEKSASREITTRSSCAALRRIISSDSCAMPSSRTCIASNRRSRSSSATRYERALSINSFRR